MSTSSHKRLRILVLTEGVSFLILLFIAMPLKYFGGMPHAVKYVGWAHGVLFILLCALLLQALIYGTLRFSRVVLIFIASLLPFAPFMIDHKLRDAEIDSDEPTV
ncbi:MAG: DUF3817 domain-containing protein [Chthoniobacterales bacterium]